MGGEALKETFAYSPLLFAGFAMLTEPLTAAHAKGSRLVYGAIVGALSSPNAPHRELLLTPEIAFLLGNLFAYAASPKGRFKLTLVAVEEMAAGCYDFVFKSDRKLAFRAGAISRTGRSTCAPPTTGATAARSPSPRRRPSRRFASG